VHSSVFSLFMFPIPSLIGAAEALCFRVFVRECVRSCVSVGVLLAHFQNGLKDFGQILYKYSVSVRF